MSGPRGTAQRVSRVPGNDLFAVAYVIASRLLDGGVITVPWVRERFGVSQATAKRYVSRVEICMPVQRVKVLGSKQRGRVLGLIEGHAL